MAALTPGAGGSDQSDEPCEFEVVQRQRRGVRHRSRGQPDHPKAVRRHQAVDVEGLSTRPGAAHLQDSLGRALDGGNQLAGPLLKRGHEAAVAREGDDDGRPFARVDVHAALASRQQHRDIHGIRRSGQALVRGLGLRAAGTRGNLERACEPRIAGRLLVSTDLERRASGPYPNHAHVAGRQRPGLIRADHRRRAK